MPGPYARRTPRTVEGASGSPVIVGNILAFGVITPILTYLFYSQELTITWGQAFAAVVSNASVQVIIGVPLLFLLAKRNAQSNNLKKED